MHCHHHSNYLGRGNNERIIENCEENLLQCQCINLSTKKSFKREDASVDEVKHLATQIDTKR